MKGAVILKERESLHLPRTQLRLKTLKCSILMFNPLHHEPFILGLDIKGKKTSLCYLTTSVCSWPSIEMPFFKHVQHHPSLISHCCAVHSATFSLLMPKQGSISSVSALHMCLGLTSPVGSFISQFHAVFCTCSSLKIEYPQ